MEEIVVIGNDGNQDRRDASGKLKRYETLREQRMRARIIEELMNKLRP